MTVNERMTDQHPQKKNGASYAISAESRDQDKLHGLCSTCCNVVQGTTQSRDSEMGFVPEIQEAHSRRRCADFVLGLSKQAHLFSKPQRGLRMRNGVQTVHALTVWGS